LRPSASLKPDVPRDVARVIAGLIWVGVGLLIAARGLGWALLLPPGLGLALVAAGVAGGALFWRLLFVRVVGRNLDRLSAMPGRMCVFALQSWKGWALVGVMVLTGVLLRHSGLPRAWLVPPYVAMGGVLLWGGTQILRAGGRAG